MTEKIPKDINKHTKSGLNIEAIKEMRGLMKTFKLQGKLKLVSWKEKNRLYGLFVNQ